MTVKPELVFGWGAGTAVLRKVTFEFICEGDRSKVKLDEGGDRKM